MAFHTSQSQRRPHTVRVPAERHRPGDMVAVAVITVLVIVAAVVVWVTGDRAHTTLKHGAYPTMGAPITREPTGLKVLWEASSPLTRGSLTRGPLTAGPVIVTGSHDTVVGRSPATGEMVWEYHRNRSLCGLESAWGEAISVWQFSGGCGDVMLLRGSNGHHGPSRSGFSPAHPRIVTGGQHVLSIGPHTVESWRSDMVRTLLVGPSETPLEPEQKKQPHCSIADAVENNDSIGVLQRCPGDTSLRFTFFRAVPEEDTTPETEGTWLTDAHHGAVIEVTESQALLYLEEPAPHFVILRHEQGEDEEDSPVLVHVAKTMESSFGQASLLGVPIVRTDKSLFWSDGENLYSFDAETLALKWSTAHITGTPAVLSDMVGSLHWLVAPVRGGLALLDGNTGEKARFLPVPGPSINKVIVVGGTIVAQQGDKVLGLAPA